MKENKDAAKAAAFNAMDHDLQARRSGNWLPPISPAKPMDPAEFNAMDHAIEHGPQQPNPSAISAMSQPDAGTQGSGEK